MRGERPGEDRQPCVLPGPELGRWNPPPPGPSAADEARPALGRRGPFLVAAGVALVVLAALAVVLATDVAGEQTRQLVSDVGLIPLAGCLTVTAWCAARASAGREQLAWLLLAVAGAFWTLGELAWYDNRSVAARMTDPTWADVFYLAAVLPAAGSLLAFSRRGRGGERTRDLLGALVVGGSVLFVSKALALSAIFPAADRASPLARAVYVAYPVTDIVLATLAILVLMRVEATRRTSLALVALGMLAYAVSDTWYAYRGGLGSYDPGTVWDLGWAFGYLLMALAPLAPDTMLAHPPDRRAALLRASGQVDEGPTASSSLAVYGPVTVAVVVAVLRPSPPDDLVLAVSGIAVLALFGLRQALLAREHARLRRSLRERVAELENRTAELGLLAQQTDRIVAAVLEGVLEIAHDGRVRFANPAAARLLARPATSLIGTDEGDLFADAPTESVVATVLRTGQEATTATATFRRGDGTTFPVELAVGPVLDDGRVLGGVVVFRELGERRADA